MTVETKAQKRELRSELIAARARLSQEERLVRSQLVAARLEALPLLAPARLVALYAPLGTEVDSFVVARLLGTRGVRVTYPRTVPGERRLVFCACEPFELARGPLGAAEPPASARVVDLADLDAFLVPGVGFSEDGLRLGRGGGYYDVTLKLAPRAVRVGVAFDLQVRPSLPRDPHDAPLDAVVTESRTLLFPRGDPA
ncbi:MAG: 5-formyltetrahydrofolate cyclo-ligase [Anaeromyxobacter sp.]|nr:5-formyltetrahydrofolate cyclo-ligase [Anaeromyxobacter sp.]MBL0277252.1 5-formyltetrahydrofolate cyclo-ligase [Anaeromyxobacter sp.]